ncbi:MAG: hypothetical protein GYA23_05655 [Methanomicrobiales archaeon]|nr:hypothetical protein [Methanomicrobiales archaeon]
MSRLLCGKVLAAIILAALLIAASPSISADEMYPTVTDVFFEKDGLPYNDSVQFTVNCYGYQCKSWDCQRDPSDLLARNGNFTPELVFTYHATCPSYGCRIYEPYYHAERNFGTTCNLEGSTHGRSFTINNFSQSAIPKSCSDLHQVAIGKGYGEYYQITPEYNQCIDDSRRNSLRCNHYLISCEPGMDYECGYWVVDDHYVKETPSYRACRDTIDRERRECDKFLKKIDPATMIMWVYPGYHVSPAMRSCELRFAIPPGNDSAKAFVPPMQAAHIEMKNEGGSLFCRIVRIFGGTCE